MRAAAITLFCSGPSRAAAGALVTMYLGHGIPDQFLAAFIGAGVGPKRGTEHRLLAASPFTNFIHSPRT